MKPISIFSSDCEQDKQQHLPKCQSAPLIRHLFPTGNQNHAENSSDVLTVVVMMYSYTTVPGH